MMQAFVALRSAVFACGFRRLWSWVALMLRRFDSGPLADGDAGAGGGAGFAVLYGTGSGHGAAGGDGIYYLAWKYVVAFHRVVEAL